MNKSSLLGIVFVLTLSNIAQGEVNIEHLRGVQRVGTKLVDIYYDVTGTEEDVTVSVEVSADGGGTYAVPVTSVSGDVGGGIKPGKNLKITWDAGVDWGDQFSVEMRYRLTVTADDAALPEGFVTIPAGSFTMGLTKGRGGAGELPTRSVFVREFAIAKTEVTKREWDEVWTWARSNGYVDLTTGGGRGNDHPVHTTTWKNAVKWCNAKSELDGRTPCYRVKETSDVFRAGDSSIELSIDYGVNGYRLPSEAEWEKAARGGLNGQRFPWGDTITHGHANYYSRSDIYEYDESSTMRFHPDWFIREPPSTSPVGEFAANGYGLFDMAGNVNEWCNDYYDPEYYAKGENTDPMGPTSGFWRVVRGGSWRDHADPARCASRNRGGEGSTRDSNLGFRLALSSTAK